MSLHTQTHYKGKSSLYKFAEDWQLNSYEFDILKRVVRCRHKDRFQLLLLMQLLILYYILRK